MKSSRWPLAGITAPPRPATARPVADLQRPGQEWFHIGEPRNEIVGDQPDDASQPGTASDVYIFGSIGGWGGVTAEDFVRDVAGLDVDRINLHLNSPGGSAWEGVAIANVLRAHRATVTVWVDGIAASACSVIAMAGDEVVMGVGAQLMIHDAAGSAWGDAATMRQAATMLDSTSDAIADTYAAKAGGTAAEWRQIMIAESWYTATEAVEAGLADRVATDDDRRTASGEQVVPGSRMSWLWDLWDSLGDPERHADALAALYVHAGRDDAPPPPMPGRLGVTPAPTALSLSYDVGDRVQVTVTPHAAGQTTGTVAEVGTTAYGVVFDAMPQMGVHHWYVASELEPEPGTDGGGDMAMSAAAKKTQAPQMPGRAPGPRSPAASAAGSTPSQEGSRAVDFTDEQLTTMRQQLGLPEDATEATIQAALTQRLAQPAAPPPTNTLPDGAVAVDRAAYDELMAAAADGRAARQQQLAEHRARLVTAAVADGRIPPARREHWLTALTTDPEGAEASLAALAPGLIPVGPELGHAANEGDVDLQVDDAALDQLAALAGLPKGALRG